MFDIEQYWNQTRSNYKQKVSLFRKAFRLLTEQPFDLYNQVLGVWHFYKVRPFILWQSMDKRIEIGKNARIQGVEIIRIFGDEASISIGDDIIIYRGSLLCALGKGRIEIGNYSTFGGVELYARSKVTIGNHVLFSNNIFIQDYNPHPVSPELRRLDIHRIHQNFMPHFSKVSEPLVDLEYDHKPKPITIEDDVWIGTGVTILKGVTIGKGSIIGAGSVITKSIPPYSIVGGNPAKVIRTLDPEEVRAKEQIKQENNS